MSARSPTPETAVVKAAPTQDAADGDRRAGVRKADAGLMVFYLFAAALGLYFESRQPSGSNDPRGILVAGLSVVGLLWAAARCACRRPTGRVSLRPRVSIRWLMVRVALLALLFGAARALLSPSDRRTCWSGEPGVSALGSNYADGYHAMMADFCTAEADLFDERAAECRRRAKRDLPWSDPSEEAEILKDGPYLNDLPDSPSWSAQAGVWKRAAARGRKAAERHRQMSINE